MKKARKFSWFVLILLLIVTGCTKITEAPPHQPQQEQVIKAVWLTHVGNAFYTYTGRLDDVLHQISRLNFNRVYVGVYNNGVTYPTRVSYRNRETNIPWFNPLNAAINLGKRQGLKIYAWYEYGLMLSPRDVLAQKHPDWLLAAGKVVNNCVWLDPSNPEVQQYFQNLFTEVAYLYPKLVGIQLDDHWSVPREFGDYSNQLTQLTAQVAATIKKIHPDWIISVSPNPPSFAYQQYNQNWLNWVYQGYANEVVVQIYRPTTEAVNQTLPSSGLFEASQYVPVAAGIYTGFSGRGLDIKSLGEVKQQVQAVQNQGYGYSLFTYEYTFGFLRLAKAKTKESFFR
ncbi:glycoside hydrolase family 10 protein [Gloeocapsa sp. PCC 73106]|uniref:glycoside hydrolase family 10 protein n=1 Tax=Gloeocapsa sp. PCC 73106 TaxID=102232 RepID=UPI0002AC22F4|nr:family 10 glycosylhydrolase [Gloeocapsa sp. PCC 73106]ELR96357.1 hypothetical protein GLO73106DRAFT_00001490 [Gloeocapsa sp. PCC 73106]